MQSREEPILNTAGAVNDFPAINDNSFSIKFKENIGSKTGNHGTKDVEIMVP